MVGAIVEAINSRADVETGTASRRVFGGDRFYILARLLTASFILVTTWLMEPRAVWPAFNQALWINLLISSYAVISLLLVAILAIRANDLVRIGGSLFDLAILLTLTWRIDGSNDPYFPLYLIPLVAAIVQLSRSAGLGLGIVTALAYGAVTLPDLLGNTDPNSNMWLALVALGLRVAVLMILPWVVNELMARNAVQTKQEVVSATRESERASREANTYREQMRSLYEVAYTLSTTMNYQSVLDVALSESRRLVSYSVAMVLLSTGKEDELFIAAGRGINDREMQMRFQVGQGCIGRTLRSSEPMIVGDISREPELQGLNALRNCHAGCVVPLRAALRTYGVMLIAAEPPTMFTQDHLGMVTALANYAIVALHNAQLIHDLREDRAKLISKEEEVRHQLARDLHDGPAQSLAAITMNIEFLKKLLERDPKRVLPELDKMGQLAKRTTYEVRTMLFELRPLALETQGLDITLKQYLDRFQNEKTKVVIEADAIDASLDTKVEGTLFNIIQEAVNNALKHAQAQHIWVRMRKQGSVLETTIQDDGRGFDLAKVRASYEQRGSFGLLNIEERAKLIGGFAELHSAPGHGTTVRVIVPVVS